MRLLLHTCCAPCAIYPMKQAKEKNLDIAGFFYNPNIHPEAEYKKRQKESTDFFTSEGAEVITCETKAEDFFGRVPAGRPAVERCPRCWRMRLEKTHAFAVQNGFDAFSTTLLGSPYQDHQTLIKICNELAEDSTVRFYYEDFRIGFKDAHRIAKDKGIYCQNYCGCVFSLMEKEEARVRRKAR